MSGQAIDILQDIRASTLENAAPLPLKEEVRAQWQGLGFVVGGARCVSKLGDVAELLPVPKLTSLPSVKEWVLGVANIRGRLIPVVDLHQFLNVPSTQPTNQWRVLVVEHGDLAAGLVVEQSIGIQHFSEDSYEDSDGSGLGEIAPFVCGAFRHGGRVFHEVQLKAILQDERFFDVAQTD